MKVLDNLIDLAPYVKTVVLKKRVIATVKKYCRYALDVEFDEDIALVFNLNAVNLKQLYLSPLLKEHKPDMFGCDITIRSQYSISAGTLHKIERIDCKELRAGIIYADTIIAEKIKATAIECNRIYSGYLDVMDIKCEMLYCETINNADITATKKACITTMRNCNKRNIVELTVPCKDWHKYIPKRLSSV